MDKLYKSNCGYGCLPIGAEIRRRFVEQGIPPDHRQADLVVPTQDLPVGDTAERDQKQGLLSSRMMVSLVSSKWAVTVSRSPSSPISW